MTLEIPTPRGFLIAPNGAKSSMRLVFVLIAITVLLVFLVLVTATIWLAIKYPAAYDKLVSGDSIFALFGSFMMHQALKWKAVQSGREPLAPPVVVAPVPAAEVPEVVTAPAKPLPPVPAGEEPPVAAAPAPVPPESTGTGIIRPDGSEVSAPDLDAGRPAPTEPAPLASTLDEQDAGENLQLVALLAPPVPQECIDFILEQEGVDQPSEWPGDGSGISIGYGYDLGFEQHFQRDWAGVIPTAWLSELSIALGHKNEAAHELAPRFRGIRITVGEAHRVFVGRTLPQEMASMRRAMPGIDNAPPMIQGAVLSLGYNRGWGMEDEPGEKSRLGMRQIRDAVAANEYAAIPKYIEEMAPLWPAGNGVHKRRLAEAKLAESGLSALV